MPPSTGTAKTDAQDDIFEAAFSRVREAAERIGIHDEVLQALHYPRETLAANLLLRHDDGSLSSHKARRCRYSDVLGPTKGGIRFHAGSSLREVMALSLWMTMKCAVVDLPFGKDGLNVAAVREDKRRHGSVADHKGKGTRKHAKAGVQVIPDILANAGGVTVSYFEWLQNRSGDRWPAAQVQSRLEEVMTAAARRVGDTALQLDCGFREAAYAVALRRIEAAVLATSPLCPEESSTTASSSPSS